MHLDKFTTADLLHVLFKYLYENEDAINANVILANRACTGSISFKSCYGTLPLASYCAMYVAHDMIGAFNF